MCLSARLWVGASICMVWSLQCYPCMRVSIEKAVENRSLTVGGVISTEQHGYPFASGTTLPRKEDDIVHIALIFDTQTREFARQVVRSVRYYSGPEVAFHLVTHVTSNFFKEESQKSRMYFYSYDHCQKAANLLRPFSSPDYRKSALCKMFLSSLLNVTRVLYIDNDVTCTSNVRQCWMNISGEFGMAVDMGEICQVHPNQCWPIGFIQTVSHGLRCGGDPKLVRHYRKVSKTGYCPQAGDTETLQVNSGMILFNLQGMRDNGFEQKFVATVVDTYREVQIKARWGEQDFINNYVRYFPNALNLLPCGCNYQYTAIRRAVRCPNGQVVLARGSLSALRSKKQSSYSVHFAYFLGDRNGALPRLDEPKFGKVVNTTVGMYSHTFTCPLQNYDCVPKVPNVGFYNETLFVITRSNKRPSLLTENQASVSQQTYHKIVHHIVEDNEAEPNMFENTNIMHHEALQGQLQREKSHQFPDVTGWRNTSSPLKREMEGWQVFLECLCSNSFLLSRYLRVELEKVAHLRGGVVMILDDDYIFNGPYAAAEVMSQLQSPGELLIFRADQGHHPTSAPFCEQFPKGNTASSNIAFHSEFYKNAKNHCRQRAQSHRPSVLPNSLVPRFLDKIITRIHPLRAQMIDMGLSGDLPTVTVLITSYETGGLRRIWLQSSISRLISPEYRGLVAKVLVVWNNQISSKPTFNHPSVEILQGSKNSLNNRWIQTLPYINTDIILNLDDDVFISKDAILCLLGHYMKHPGTLLGPYARLVTQESFVIDELKNFQSFSMLLPRVLLLPKMVLVAYSRLNFTMTQYIDVQEGHCDDILLNAVARHLLGMKLVRVVMPSGSIEDYYRNCYKKHRGSVGGLALKRNRKRLRNNCARTINGWFHEVLLKQEDNVVMCDGNGQAVSVPESLQHRKFDNMFAQTLCSL